MAFNGPIRVPFVNHNGSLSNPQSHFDAYTKKRAESGQPVTHMSRRGIPEGFHHEDHTKTNGVAKPFAETQKHLAGSVRDSSNKHVYNRSAACPAQPVLIHHPPPKVDHSNLPHFKPNTARGSNWAASELTFYYKGHGATFAPRAPTATALVTQPNKGGYNSSNNAPERLPAAGRRTAAYVREVRQGSVHSSTYPHPGEVAPAYPTKGWLGATPRTFAC